MDSREHIVTNEPQQQVALYYEKLRVERVGLKIIEIIRGNLEVPVSADVINYSSNIADLGINSITFIRIVVAIETEFDFEFGDEDLDANKYPTVYSIVIYVENRLSELV